MSTVHEIERMRRDIGDAELVEMSVSGQPDAFDVLVRRHQRAVYGAAFAVVANREAALDVLQESFIAAYRQLHTLDDGSRFGPWVYGIARNQAKRLRRVSNRHAFRERPLLETEAAPNGPQADTLAERISDALAALTDTQADVVTLFYMEGYSIAECAAILEVPQGTIKRRLHDARQRLKKEMTDMVKQHLKEFELPEDYRVVIDKPAPIHNTSPSLVWFRDRWILLWQDGVPWEPYDGPFWFWISESADGRNWSEPKRLDIQPQWQALPKLCVQGDELAMHTHHHHYGLRIHSSENLTQWTEWPMIHAFDVGRSDVFSIGVDLFLIYPIWRPHDLGDAVEMLKSSDSGVSWTWLNQPYASNKNGITDAAGCAFDGRIIAVWRGHEYPVGAENPNNVYICRSEDDGRSWTDPVLVEPLSTKRGSFSLQILRAPDGRLAISQEVCTEYTAGTGEIWVAISGDGGQTWQDRGIYSTGELRSPAIAFAPDGSLMIAGSSRTDDEARPWVIHSHVEHQ